MPRRSNDFQRLIQRIYEQLAPSGATVTESVMLPDSESKGKVEVDVLLEHVIAGLTIRIAVECQKRGRVSDREWIDQLVGKYRGVTVNQLVAVARRGFSKGARAKAAANRIELRTLDTAMETDWPSTLIRLGAGLVEIHLGEFRMKPQTLPRWTEPNPPSVVVAPNGKQLTFQEFVDELASKVGPHSSKEWLNLGVGKSISELEGQRTWHNDLGVPGVDFVDSQGRRFRVEALKVSVRSGAR